MVFFEAPHRTGAALQAMAEAWGSDRPAAVCRELTKTHEEVVRGGLAELAAWAADGVRGEVTLVVAGRTGPAVVPDTPAEVAALVAAEEAAGLTRKDAIRAVAQRTGLPRREVYDVVHRAPRPAPEGTP
jgi:16S rRNA (cytidine1402-2'-O)-methyltransferase